MADSQRTEELDPRDPRIPGDIGLTYLALRQWKDAERAAFRALALDPHNALAASVFHRSRLNSTGDVDSARRALDGFPEAIKSPPLIARGATAFGDVGAIIGRWVYLDVIERRFPDSFQALEKAQEIGPVPYHYVRFASDGHGDVLIVGGEDHKTGQAADCSRRFVKLERWARDRFPFVGEVTDHWSGQVMEPVDGVAYIGRNLGDKNVYVVTGDSGNDITHGIIAGVLIGDLMAGRENPWAKLYDPPRKTLKSRVLADYIAENANVAAQFRDYITPGSIKSADEIRPGRGAVLRHGVKKIATYRDDNGNLHAFSAVCPHLGCVVRWDACEKTWGCPCHGSRFDALGCVVNGPAISDLEPVEVPES